MSSCLNQTKINQPSDFSACLPTAQKVKIESTTEQPIQLFEVQVMSPGIYYNESEYNEKTMGKDENLSTKESKKGNMSLYYLHMRPIFYTLFATTLSSSSPSMQFNLPPHPGRQLSDSNPFNHPILLPPQLFHSWNQKGRYDILTHLYGGTSSCLPFQIARGTPGR